MRKIEGFVPVVSTPMTPSGEVDTLGLENLLGFLLGKRIGGLWLLGTGGEDMNLTFEKRLKVAEIAAKYVDNRVPLILGAAFYALEDSFRFMEMTRELPKEGYHVMPYHPVLSEAAIVRYYERLADRASVPLWLYTSGNWSQQLSLDSIRSLKAHPNVAGIKFSSSNAVAAIRVLSLQSDDFQVITAVAAQLYPSLCMGAKAHTSSLGSPLPDPMIEIVELKNAGKHDEALCAQRKLNDFLLKFTSGAKKDNFLMAAEEKYVLFLRGLCEAHVSPYYRGLTEEEKVNIRNALNEFGYLDVYQDTP